MGQRLNLEIVDNGEVIANSYYHWGGYLRSAVALIDCALNKLKQLDRSKCDNVEVALRMLYATGAGLSKDQLQYAPQDLIQQSYGRNEGIIGLTETAIEETRFWANENAIIDIGNETVDISQLFFQHDITDDQYNCDDVIIDIKYKSKQIKFKQWNRVYDVIYKNNEQLFKFEDTDVCTGVA